MLTKLESRLSMRHLNLVVAIADKGSLLAAADTVGLTQSAVTKALQEAEAIIGARLFERGNRGVTPTADGLILAAHARLVLSQLRHAGQELDDLRSGTGGRVAVGVSVSAAVHMLPAAIAAVRKTRPNLAITVQEGTTDILLPHLRQGQLDLIVGRLPAFSVGSDIAEEILCGDHARIVVRMGHPLLTRKGLTLRDLSHEPWILPRQETSLRRQIDEAFRIENAQAPANCVESVSILTNRALVLHADHLAVWPVQLVTFEQGLGHIAALPIELPTMRQPIGICTLRNTRLSPAAETLILALRHFARPISDETSVMGA